MILLVLRWSKRRTKSKVRATQHDNDLPLQKEGANGVVNGIQDLYGRGKSRDFAQFTPITTKLSQQGALKRYLPDCMIISLPDQRSLGHG